LGNVVYFSAEPFLSAQVRHSLYQFDAGLILDFAILRDLSAVENRTD
jgi:hypothetical protein